MSRKNIILLVALFTLLIVSNIEVNAFSPYNERVELIIEDSAYDAWKEAQMPKHGASSVGDYGHLITYIGSDQCMTSYLYQFMDDIPATAINYLVANGWTITVTDAPVYLDGWNVAGYTDFSVNQIFITTSYSFDGLYYDPGLALVHEIGHVVYRKLAKSTDIGRETIYRFYGNEVGELYYHDGQNRDYICKSLEEAMAQFFYEYIYYPFETSAVAPTISGLYSTVLNGGI